MENKITSFVSFLPHIGKTVRNEVQTVGFGVFSIGFKKFSVTSCKNSEALCTLSVKVFPKWLSEGVLRRWDLVSTISDFNPKRSSGLLVCKTKGNLSFTGVLFSSNACRRQGKPQWKKTRCLWISGRQTGCQTTLSLCFGR